MHERANDTRPFEYDCINWRKVCVCVCVRAVKSDFFARKCPGTCIIRRADRDAPASKLSFAVPIYIFAFFSRTESCGGRSFTAAFFLN